MRRVAPLCLLVPLLACGGSSSPTTPSSPATPQILEGQTVNVLDGSASPNLSLHVGSQSATSDENGNFRVEVNAPGPYRTIIQGAGVVDRETTIPGQSSERARLSLIPQGFDLGAYDEMFRASNGRLQRWRTRPSLVVLASVMSYGSGGGSQYLATAEQMTGGEVDRMIEHLSEGLALLTGNTFTSFADVDVERPEAGERVDVLRNGRIVVGRYSGIEPANTIGYGQWSEAADGTVTGGSVFLDRDFDKDDRRRRLLRIHELGHALGYQHVQARTSIMNLAIGPEPTDFDRAGALIAFQRPVGNRAPDVDPLNVISALAEGGSRWMPPIPCR